MKTILFMIIASYLLISCNGKSQGETKVCDADEIMSEDNTCVNSGFYDISDEAITSRGGQVELSK